jgi:isopropylmalate/homocitrate/citramalate synthase
VGAVLASLLFLGAGVAIWPWTWSEAERRHHTVAAIWTQIRPTAGDETPWTRYGAWAIADDQRIELMLVTRRGTADEAGAASPFTLTIKRRLDPDEVDDAADAMEALRQEAAALETRAYERHRDTVSAAVGPAGAVRTLEPAADDDQRRAEVKMLGEVAAEEAGERRAQASAVARALRRT